MVDETQGANPQTSPPENLEGAIASSPEAMSEAQEKVSESATPQQAETQQPVKQEQGEAPLHENPRFKEVIDEKNWWKEQYMRQQQQPQAPAPQQQPQQQQADPYANMTPEEQAFWRNVDTRAEQKAKQILQKNVTPQLQAGVQEIARIRETIFLKEHPDIKKGTPEYQQIVEKVTLGIPTEDAYRSVMWDRKVATNEASNRQQQQQKLNAKRQANAVSSQSVSQAVSPSKKETFEQELERRMRTEWNGEI